MVYIVKSAIFYWVYLVNKIKDMPDLTPDKFKKITATPNKLSSKDRAFWNSYIDNLEKKGLRGSPKLNSIDISRSEFDNYVKESGQPYTYDQFIPNVQGEIVDYRNNAINQIKTGKANWAGYKGDGNFDGFMPNLSAQDGLAGEYTTSYKFPADMVPVINRASGQVDATAVNTAYDPISIPKFKKTTKRQ